MVNGASNLRLTLVIGVVGFTSWMLGVEAAEDEEEDDALASRLRLLALVGEPVGGVAAPLECV